MSQQATKPNIQDLAIAKVRASQTYNGLIYASTKGLDEEALAVREIEIAIARKAIFSASMALSEAV